MKVCVIGLGEVGLPTALFSKNRGHTVYGLDIDPDRVDAAKKKGLQAGTDWAYIPNDIDVYQVCVTTKFDGAPNVGAVYTVCDHINMRLKKGNLVSIESTVFPGTMNVLFEDVFNFDDDFFLVHCPQRFWGADPEQRGVNRYRLLGGIDKESTEFGYEFYHNMGVIIKPVNIQVAEFAKVAENAYRHVQIAFAEELAIECDERGIDFHDLREAIMSASHMHWLPEARDGIGGHCIPMAAEWLDTMTNNKVVNASLRADDFYKTWWRRKNTDALVD